MLYAVKPITITKQWEIYQIGAEKLFVKKEKPSEHIESSEKKMEFLIETLKKKQKNILNWIVYKNDDGKSDLIHAKRNLRAFASIQRGKQ